MEKKTAENWREKKAGWLPSKKQAQKIALLYAFFGCSWILGSGWLLHHSVNNPSLEALIETIKGWLFIFVTATLLWLVLNRYFRKIHDSTRLLEESESRLRLVGDNLPESYMYQFTRDPDGTPRFNYISAGVEHVHGFKPADLMRDASPLFAQLDAEQMAAYMTAETASARQLSDFEMDLRFRHPDGKERLIRAKSRPARQPNGQLCWDGFAVDITERRRTEEALRQGEQNYREIFNTVNDAIFLQDAVTGRILDVNDAVLRLYGYDSKEELLAGNFRKLTSTEPPYDNEEAQRRIRMTVEQGPQIFEWLSVKKNGEQFWVEVSLSSSKIGGNGRILAVVRDISERKASVLEIQRLSRLYATLSQVNQIIVRCQSRIKLFDDICRVMVEFGKFKFARIYEPSGDTPVLKISAQHGQDKELEQVMPKAGCEAGARAFETGCAMLCNDICHDSRATACCDLLPRLGIQSCAAFPLRLQGKVCGALTICSGEANFFQAEENLLLEEIAADISYALDQMEEQGKRQKAEVAAQINRAKLEAALSSMTDAVFISDIEGRFIEFNEAFAKFHKFKSKADCGKTLADYPSMLEVYAPDGSMMPLEQWAVPRALRGETATNTEYTLRRKDTGEKWTGSYSFAPIRDQNGAVTGSVVVARDVTEQKKAEERLRLSEMKFERAFSNNPAAIVLTRLEDGVVLEVNNTWETLTGFSRAEIIGRSARSMWPSAKAAAQFVSKIKTHGVVRGCEQEFRIKSGEWITVQLSSQSMDINGENVILSTLVDVTEQKRTEQSLQESEVQFRGMFELASIGMAQADPVTGQFVRVNNKMCKITGYTQAELLRLSVREITHPDDRATDWELFQRVIRGELSDYRTEKRYLNKNGKMVWVNVNMTILRDAGGRPIRTLATIEDISERRRAEEALQLQGAALNAAANAIVITDKLGNIEWSNNAFKKITGYSAGEVIGKNPRFLKSGEHNGAFYQDLWNTIISGNIWQGEIVNRRKDGSFYNEDLTITPVRDISGNISHFIAVKQDITERKRLESQFRQAQKMEAVGQLAGGVAHDFNNNLQVIFGYCQLLTAQMTDGSSLHDLVEIRNAAERSASLTRQLLAFSRRQLITLVVLNLNTVINNTGKMLKRLIGENIRLVIQPDSDLQPIKADTGNMEQIIMNLVVNARDAMPSGGQITITTSNQMLDENAAGKLAEARPGNFVRLTVSDTGCGMDNEILQRIFEPFFSTKGSNGTGLGLAVIYGIVKQHEGWVNVTSKIKQGTTFDVYLPVHAEADTDPSGDRTAKSPAAPRAHGERILILEDEPSLRHVNERFLKNAGYEVHPAENAAAAKAIFDQQGGRFDLFFTDVVLPDGNGFDIAEEFKRRNPAMAVLISSGYTDERARWGDSEASNFQFIQKPYMAAKLLELIRKIFEGRSRPN